MMKLFRQFMTVGVFLIPLSAAAGRPLACIYDESAGGQSGGKSFIGAKCTRNEVPGFLYGTNVEVTLTLKTEALSDMTVPMSDLEECHAILYVLSGRLPNVATNTVILAKPSGKETTPPPVPYLRIKSGTISRKISYGKFHDTNCSPVAPGEHERPISVAQKELAERKNRLAISDQKAKDKEAQDSAASPSRLGEANDGPGIPTRKVKPASTTDLGTLDLKGAAQERGWVPSDSAQ